MKTALSAACAAVLTVTFASPAPALAPARQTETAAIPEGIRTFFRDYFRAVENGDPDGILAFIDSDFVIKWPIGPAISDRAQLRAALQSVQQRVRQEIAWEVLEAKVQGNWAWVRSVERPTHYPKAGGDPRTLDGERLTILRKVQGRWLMHRDYSSLNQLPPDLLKRPGDRP